MTDKVEICNLALGNIRAQSINSLTENSINAQYCKLYYDTVRQALLRAHDWNFAHSEKAMALLSSTELFSFAYVYQYPSDCLKINYLKHPLNQVGTTSEGFAFRPDYYDDNPLNDLASRRLRIPYETRTVAGNRVIGANEPDLWIDYTADMDDPNKYDALFVITLSWYLSSMLAIPVIGGEAGREERKVASMIYNDTFNSAVAEDLNENNLGAAPESEHILARS